MTVKGTYWIRCQWKKCAEEYCIGSNNEECSAEENDEETIHNIHVTLVFEPLA